MTPEVEENHRLTEVSGGGWVSLKVNQPFTVNFKCGNDITFSTFFIFTARKGCDSGRERTPKVILTKKER